MKATICKNRCFTVVKWLTIAVVVGFFAAVAVSYFVNRPQPVTTNELPHGGPVVAPTTTNSTTYSPDQNKSPFGNERYIWDDWSN